jgi:N-methylhydantoinase A
VENKQILSIYATSNSIGFMACHNDKLEAKKIRYENDNKIEAIKEGIEYYKMNFKFKADKVIIASTTANDIITQRKGVKTALIVTSGFKDLLKIGRRSRNSLYDFMPQIKEHVVSRENIFEVEERVNADGSIETELNKKQFKSIIKNILNNGYRAVAVGFINSLVNNENEQATLSILRKSGLQYTLSSEISTYYREYERISTAVLNSYIYEPVKNFLTEVSELFDENVDIKIMETNGGVTSFSNFRYKDAIQTLFSGNIASLVGARTISKELRNPKIITFDMSSSSSDISIFDDQITLTSQMKIDDLPVRIPSVLLRTIGQGGLSTVEKLDKGIKLDLENKYIGEEYHPTLKDISTYLGYIDSESEEKEQISIKIKNYFSTINDIEINKYVEGVFKMAVAKFSRHMRKLAAKRGYDTKEFNLLTTGSMSGIFSTSIAENLSSEEIIIPYKNGFFSVLGMLHTNVIKDSSKLMLKRVRPSKQFDFDEFNEVFETLKKEVKNKLIKEKIFDENIKFYNLLDIRYEDESYEMTIPFTKDFIDKFHKEHQKLYGYYLKNSLLEIVRIRVRGLGVEIKPNLKRVNVNDYIKTNTPKYEKKQKAIFDGKEQNIPIYKRENLPINTLIKGPAIIKEYGSTTLISPKFVASIDKYKNIIIRYKAKY